MFNKNKKINDKEFLFEEEDLNNSQDLNSESSLIPPLKNNNNITSIDNNKNIKIDTIQKLKPIDNNNNSNINNSNNIKIQNSIEMKDINKKDLENEKNYDSSVGDTIINVTEPNSNNNNNNNNNNISPINNSSTSPTNNNNISESKIIKKSKVIFNNKDEVRSMSKVINRSNNLTKSEPSSPVDEQVVGGHSQISSQNSPLSNPHGELQPVKSYPDNLNKYVSPLAKAQEINIDDSIGVGGDPDSSDDDDEEEDESVKKKKKAGFWRTLFSIKVGIIITLTVLVLLSAVGVVFRIFWENVKIVDVILLRWALYLDVCIAGFLAVYWVVKGLISLFESTLYLQQHIYYYINGFKKPLTVLFWSIIVYFTTNPILSLPSYTDDKMDTYFVTLRALMYVSLLYCGRVALVKVLAQRTNRKAFYSSLKSSLLNEELLEQLSTKKANSNLNQSVSHSLKKKKRMGITQWIDSVKNRSQLSLKLNKADNYTHKEAKRVAKQILYNADKNDKGYLIKEDLRFYVKDKHLQKAFDTFGSLHGDMITKSDIQNWVLRVVRHRKTLECRLRDHEDIGRVINEIINFFFWILIFLFVLTLYGVEISVFLVPLGTTILGLSFAFGTTLRNVFESLILIFFVRPFEIGDKVVIDTLDGLIVDRIGILFTSFKSLDGKAVYLPNSKLVLARIENHQRSEEVWVGIDLTVDFNTPVEKLYFIESKFSTWVKAQPEKWRPDVSLTFVTIIGTNQITVKYGGSIISSWQDKRWRPIKNEFFFKMKEWVTETHLETHQPTQQIKFLSYPANPMNNNNNSNNNNNNNIDKSSKFPDNYY